MAGCLAEWNGICSPALASPEFWQPTLNPCTAQLKPQARDAKKRILFVDDELSMLNLFQVMFEPMKEEWEIFVSQSGEEALGLLDKHSFKAVISDMRMPGMNGTEFLQKVIQRSPNTARFILSGYSDQEQVAQSIGAAHQFLHKPCSFASLKTTLTQVCALDVFLKNESLQALAAQMTTLPSVPSVYYRLLTVLHDPNGSMESVGKLVEQDPSLTAKLLQLVNSAFWGFSRKVTNAVEAANLLGVNTIRSLALGLNTFSCFAESKVSGLSINQMWNHSLRTGLMAKGITQLAEMGSPMADEAFVAGLLHDLGTLMLSVNLPKEFAQAQAIAQNERLESWQAEAKVFRATHANMGAYLLGLWGLPASIVEAVALHHEPLKSVHRDFSPLTAVHIANALEKQNAPETREASGNPKLDRHYLAEVGVDKFLAEWSSKLPEIQRHTAEKAKVPSTEKAGLSPMSAQSCGNFTA